MNGHKHHTNLLTASVPMVTVARKGTRTLARKEDMKKTYSPPRTNVTDRSDIESGRGGKLAGLACVTATDRPKVREPQAHSAPFQF
jgi:hypothetical protein